MKTSIEIQKIREYTGHTGSIFAMAASPDESMLFTSGDDGIVAQWDLNSDERDASAVLRIGTSIYSLCNLEHSNTLFAGASNGSLYGIDLKKRKVIHTYARTKDAIYGLHHSPETHTLWVLHGGGYLSVHDLSNFTEKAFVRISQGHLRSITVDHNKNRLYVGASDNRIYVLDPTTLSKIHEWEAHENSVFSLSLHPDGKYLLSGGRDAHLNIWDVNHDYKLLKSIPAHNFTVNDFALSPSGNRFATASRDKTIKIWDAWTFELKKVINHERNEGHIHSVNKLVWLKSDNSLISCSDDKHIMRWQIDG